MQRRAQDSSSAAQDKRGRLVRSGVGFRVELVVTFTPSNALIDPSAIKPALIGGFPRSEYARALPHVLGKPWEEFAS